MKAIIKTVLLLIVSNIFMTFAWYGFLKYKGWPLWKAILICWSVALLEYAFQVPANRLGNQTLTTPQLKIIQEIITLTIFAVFSIAYLKEPFKWNYVVAFVLILGAAYFMFKE